MDEVMRRHLVAMERELGRLEDAAAHEAYALGVLRRSVEVQRDALRKLLDLPQLHRVPEGSEPVA